MAGIPATGFADGSGGHRTPAFRHGQTAEFNHRSAAQAQQRIKQSHKWKRWKYTKGELAPSVPELDPGAAGSALALLGVATALLLERRRAARA